MHGFYIGDMIANSYTHENELYNLKVILSGFALYTFRAKSPNLTAPAVWELEGPAIIGEIISIIEDWRIVKILYIYKL